jgi:hypothetical protein
MLVALYARVSTLDVDSFSVWMPPPTRPPDADPAVVRQ